MAEKFIRATRVRLIQPTKDSTGKMTSDWHAGNTKSLVIFPDSGIARADLGKPDEVSIAKFASADVEVLSQSEWERGALSCPYCDKSFETPQALGSHKSTVHFETESKRQKAKEAK